MTNNESRVLFGIHIYLNTHIHTFQVAAVD